MNTRTEIGDCASEIRFEDIAPGGRVGLLALATDLNSETDLRRIFPSGIEIFTNRVTNANPVTMDNLRAMSGDITRAAAGILPGYGVDVVIYGCTSGTVAIGEAQLEKLIRAAHPDTPSTNPITATRNALRAFGAKKISILTPYTRAVNETMLAHFLNEGFEVLSIEGFGLDKDLDMTCLPAQAIHNAAIKACRDEADLLFISCTALRSATAIEALEQKLGKPVVTSNQAIVWHALQLMESPARVEGFGRLFDLTLNPKGSM
ncbi:maleate cis-trans isomerase family protein [Aestuariispira insulae]|uniref:Maleate isomerase n=1 Tax=Aestuariispira insulae TaxID=1461337 RepID=A0A3D9H1M6_9PROT|nr:Asp/Glu racemase [Aestuariispira insulae]RED43395.1 maleate isomerase [Aestuariispira insulae]